MTKTLKWLLIILVGIILIGAAFFIGQWVANRTNKETTTTATIVPKKTNPATKEKEETSTPAEEETAADEFGDWETFTNSDFGWEIRYPAGSKIEYGDDTEAKNNGLKNGKYCVTISTEKGHVTIAAKENKTAQVICGRTGVGQDYQQATDTAEVGEKTYDTKGMKLQYASAGNHDEFYHFSLEDGTNIEYGVDLNDRYDDVKFEDAMAEVKKIVKSFKTL